MNAKLEIGLKVKLTLKSKPEEWIEGEIFAFDEEHHSFVVLQQPTASPKQTKSFRIINCHSISLFQSLSSVGELHQSLGLNSDADLVVDEAVIRSREATVLQQARQLTPPLGSGVTEEAQSIFNALHKTLPVEWRGKSIVILKDAIIAPPYDAVSGGTEALRRQINRVIIGEKQRLAAARSI